MNPKMCDMIKNEPDETGLVGETITRYLSIRKESGETPEVIFHNDVLYLQTKVPGTPYLAVEIKVTRIEENYIGSRKSA